MRILLPPSETKRLGGGNSVFSYDALSYPELTEGRKKALAALHKLSLSKREASKVLKLSAKQLPLLDANRSLLSSPVMPAIERYTGVLYDALDAAGLDAQSRSWASESVRIQSSLFGLIGAEDGIPMYRLSASTPLPGLMLKKKPIALKAFWQAHHSNIWDDEESFVLDLRSKDYVALNPIAPGVSAAWVNIVSRTDAGEVRALNHFNKTAKGELVKLLAGERPKIDTREEFLDWATGSGVECALEATGEITLIANSVSLKAGQIA
jgi:cytoplasmic iron level regulating protein YaaA (DUF328/UPF0246 family)